MEMDQLCWRQELLSNVASIRLCFSLSHSLSLSLSYENVFKKVFVIPFFGQISRGFMSTCPWTLTSLRRDVMADVSVVKESVELRRTKMNRQT